MSPPRLSPAAFFGRQSIHGLLFRTLALVRLTIFPDRAALNGPGSLSASSHDAAAYPAGGAVMAAAAAAIAVVVALAFALA